jgi:calcineurin-like phosphoesterase family protein
MTTRWYTSDLHFGHVNIIKYEDRPYDSIGEMNADMVERWNAQVHPTDTVTVLGDFAMGHINDTLPLVGDLNGDIWLLCGNHDRPWHGNGEKAAGWEERYLAAGFHWIDDGNPTFSHFYPVGDRTLRGNHFPFTGIARHDDRYDQWMPKDDGEWLLHGHVHSAWLQKGKQVNVGFDPWGGQLVSEERLVALIEQGPQDLAPIKWVRQ